MAKKSLSFREVLSDIKNGKFAPIYLLSGGEPYYLDVLSDAIERYAMADEDRDFNANVYYGADADLEEVMAVSRQFPMMAERRLVMLKEAQGLPGGKVTLGKLDLYAQRPSSTTVFVVVYKGDEISSTSALSKAVDKAGGVIFKSPAIRDYEVAPHIKDYCAARKISVDDKALAMLVDSLGCNLAKIFGQVDKILIAAGHTDRITAELVEKNVGISKDYNNFELQTAMATGNYAKAMKIVDYYSRNPKNNPVPLTLGLLFKFYSNLAACLFSADKSDTGLMNATGSKSTWALKEVKVAMRTHSPSKALKCITAIRQCDVMSKGVGTNTDPYLLLKDLVFQLSTLK